LPKGSSRNIVKCGAFRDLSAAELEDHVDRRIVLEETVKTDHVLMMKPSV